MADDGDDNEFTGGLPESLLPYDQWMEDAYREVMIRALEYVSHQGLAGEHHFYLTFRTDWPGTEIPARLRAQYPHEMTIVLQHQFWDLKADRILKRVTVGLSFGGVGSILAIPFAAITAFADPYIQLSLRFTPPESPKETAAEEADDVTVTEEKTEEERPDAAASVVSLDAFRKKGPVQS
ncbi:ClpXP protease specificity-enhancing factor SspB [Acetobacter sp. AN02]|uniref:SspB family protein n=1 Tax=Acetobacter sp. AN02 TaxID=2894186 RepID=UPI00243464C5|nr:ClpXP protease specificity-enhancing factor SspB [Acetobacter sp. AN02]MDG6095540.1 ClpXP protease specificity-enhancing factor SspB [Acetobacter sp. AN02]